MQEYERAETILGELGIILNNDSIIKITNNDHVNYSELIRIPWKSVTKFMKQFHEVDKNQLEQWKLNQQAISRGVRLGFLPEPTKSYSMSISAGDKSTNIDFTLSNYSLEDAEKVYSYILSKIVNK